MPHPNFPKTMLEFQQRFSTHEACLEFLKQSRWPEGFICPRCGHREYYWKASRLLLQCKSCGYQASVTANTVMHRSKMPLPVWFHAAYLIAIQTPGISAVQFQREAGLTNYETAFSMLHKLRARMVREGSDRLNGVVQLDEIYVGGEKPGIRRGDESGKVIVAGAAEMKGTGISRIRLRVIPNVNDLILAEFVKDTIVEGSTIITDDWSGYNGLPKMGYKHVVDDLALVHLHKAFSNLKIRLIGIHHGVSSQHLQAYLDEFAFRFNRPHSPIVAFLTVLGLRS